MNDNREIIDGPHGDKRERVLFFGREHCEASNIIDRLLRDFGFDFVFPSYTPNVNVVH